MAYTSYLAFDHSEAVGDLTFYYFRGIFVPDGALEELVVNLLEWVVSDYVDLTLLTDLPISFPDVIEEGTNIYEADGTPFVAPSDLYLVAVRDFPPAGFTDPDITDLFAGHGPLGVYVDAPVDGDMLATLPSDIDPDTYALNNEEYPNWHMPALDGYGAFSFFVAWFAGSLNHVDFATFDIAYNACDVPAGHIRENLDMFEYDEGPYDYGVMYWTAPSSAGYNRSSCLEDEVIGPFTINTDSGVLQLECYMPLTTNPAIWWADELLGLDHPVANNTVPTILQGVAFLAKAMGIEDKLFGPLHIFDFPLGAREVWPFSVDDEPFAADDEPFAA